MSLGGGGLISGVSVVLFASIPFVARYGISGAGSPSVIVILAAAQVATIVLFCTRNRAAWFRGAIVAATLGFAAAVITLLGLPPRSVALAVTGCSHAVAYSSLLTWFATSLRPSREPVVTSFARRVRRTMPDKVVRYTRHVTIAWCAFFASQLVLSFGLLLLAPEPIWLAFVSVLNLPLLAAMVLGEFGCRLVLFRHEPRTGLADTLSAMRRIGFPPARQP